MDKLLEEEPWLTDQVARRLVLIGMADFWPGYDLDRIMALSLPQWQLMAVTFDRMLVARAKAAADNKRLANRR